VAGSKAVLSGPFPASPASLSTRLGKRAFGARVRILVAVAAEPAMSGSAADVASRFLALLVDQVSRRGSRSGIAIGYTAVMAKVMVSLPDDVLARIDGEVERRGTTRSALLREAVLRELGRPDPVTLEAAVARSRSRFAGAGRFDAAALVRAERDALDRRRL
jgi:Arc/MetJ-type ribon-helix-helix transcriptional regulator